MIRLDLATLRRAYETGETHPDHLIPALIAQIRKNGPRPVWITLLDEESIFERLKGLEADRAAGRDLPLYGVPFAIKDNIDLEGQTTTAGCPAFAHLPPRSATVVARLEAAGAVALGKTNLDQFATGLVGARSPYGAPSSVFNAAFVSGGSSSGSAVAVAANMVSFSLGTDTAGSGRVPAAFNNIVGLKPTRGLISTAGVLPACRTLDCVSIFAGSVGDASAVLRVAAGFDAADPFSRPAPAQRVLDRDHFTFAVPNHPIDFCGDDASQGPFSAAIQRLTALGGKMVRFDYGPFAAAAALLYQGPFVAERLAALQAVNFTDWAAMDSTVATIIKGADRYSAADAFQAVYDLAALRRQTEGLWPEIDFMLLPTAPTVITHEALARDPIGGNAKLGLYTNFVNLLDLAALAVPAGFRPDGMPFGVTLIGPAFSDATLALWGDRLHRALSAPRWGATDFGLPEPASFPSPERPPVRDHITLAVVGAHLSGQPLNGQLTDRGARFIKTCRSAAGYKLYALAGTQPPKPGLVRDPEGTGHIELELWAMDAAAFGSFTALVPPPLGIGTVALEDGSSVKGFICEPAGLTRAVDITRFGGWRAYLSSGR